MKYELLDVRADEEKKANIVLRSLYIISDVVLDHPNPPLSPSPTLLRDLSI